MCKCTNVAMGSYDNQEPLYIPEEGHVMSKYINNRHDIGLSPKRAIHVDRCLSNEVLSLWQRGIRTSGCCCGHNQQTGYIGVFDEDIEPMKALGYEVRFNECRPSAQDGFYPKTVFTGELNE